MASPRDLDPKFRETEAPTDTAQDEPAKDDDTTYIVARRVWVDSEGVQQTRETRMPTSEYADWERKNG
jgi:hypothetical protein